MKIRSSNFLHLPVFFLAAALALTGCGASSEKNVTVAETAAAAAPAAGATIDAPLVGTFYAASAPDAAPFVQVGDHVKKGQTVCLMEAMKMMNEVQAPCDCVIEEILQEDGALVSFGEPLLRYREG